MNIIDKKVLLLGLLGMIAMAVFYAFSLTPRQWRNLQPTLVKFGTVGGVAVVGLGGLGIGVFVSRRRAEQRRIAAINQAVADGETWLLLRPKEARPVDVDRVTLWKRLAYAQPTAEHISFEAYGNGDRQGLAIHASQTKSRSVLREIFQEWPDVQRRPAAAADDPAFVPEGWHVHWVEIGPASTDKPVTISSRDPLLGALSEIADIPAPTKALVQVIARSDTSTRKQLGQKSASMRSGQVQDAGVRYQRTREAKQLEERGSRLFLQAVVRVAAISPYPDRAQGAARALANTLCNQFGPDNPVVVLAQASPKKRLKLAARPIELSARSIAGGAIRSWADDEIVALAHLPGGDALKFAPLLSTSSAKALPARPDLRIPKKARAYHATGHSGEPWLVLGAQLDAAGKEWQIGMPLADLQTHASIVGATGSGKSTLLRNLNLQIFDLDASIIVIEPHGDLVDDILSGCDDSRLGQAVVLDLNNPCPPAIPMLTVGLRQNTDVAKQMAMSVLRVADPNNWETAGQMREVLRHTLNVLLDAWGEMANLVWLKRFLSTGTSNSSFREQTLSRCSRYVEDSRDFCYRVRGAIEDKKGFSELKPSINGAARRVDIFLGDGRFRRSLALPQLGPVVSLPDLMNGQRMILAPVRKSELGEVNMKIFGTLLMWMTIRSLMARGDKQDRRQVAITMDEFATMAGSEAGDLTKQGLAEARKYGASIILAMQFLAQLPEDVLKEVKTNTLTKIIMNLPDDDQARQAVSMLAHPELTHPDIQAIEKFHFYGKLAEHKNLHPACYLRALPPIRLPGIDNSEPVNVPSRPRSSAVTSRIHRLVEKTRPNPDDPRDRNTRAVVDRLLALDHDTFMGVVAETGAANRYMALTLLAEPDREPDKVKRARLVSGYLYGLQWWLRDAYYWRLKGARVSQPRRAQVPPKTNT